MKIAVLVKQTPDTAELPRVTADEVNRGEVKATMAINPWDEHAVEETVRLAEQYGASTTAISMGPSEANDALRHALAIGIDDAALIDSSGQAVDINATAEVLAAAIKAQGDFDLIITGKQSVDAGTGSMPIAVACKLDLPIVTNVTKFVEVTESRVVVERLLADAIDTVAVPLPAIVSVGKEINDPRYPSFIGMRNANRADIPITKLGDLISGGIAKKTVWTNARQVESSSTECEMIDGATVSDKAARLVDALMGEKIV